MKAFVFYIAQYDKFDGGVFMNHRSITVFVEHDNGERSNCGTLNMSTDHWTLFRLILRAGVRLAVGVAVRFENH